MPTKPLQSKLSILRGFMARADWRAALKLANSFGDLGNHKPRITRGWAALQHPEFYNQIGKSAPALIDDAIVALIERYGDPVDNFKNSEM